ncbi:hypothetical protein O0I10_001507 [Lichtheimia ornata]|uniref:DNA polymerase n=1 Tax=Lichtheimia ornata TaxID=688661 RepID=A0AAD7VDC6_9FUNG|nr:uncharacterized protein O0I10_001507 [Lichtheimia ornata]KAJ8662546.1 hypothetical protein O0I10_001507 [Lichtheimia ornata]
MSDSRKERLLKLQQQRIAKDRKSQRNVDDVYVEVEEHDYHALNDDADFVEDDDNAGYIDDGMGNDEEEFSDEYDQADQKSSKRKRKNGKAADGKDKQAKKSRDIASMFSKSASRKPAPSAPAVKKEETKDDASFMDDLFANLESPAPAKPAPSQRPKPSSSRFGNGTSYISRVQPTPSRRTTTSQVRLDMPPPSTNNNNNDDDVDVIETTNSLAVGEDNDKTTNNKPFSQPDTNDEFFDAYDSFSTGMMDVIDDMEKGSPSRVTVKQEEKEPSLSADTSMEVVEEVKRPNMKYKEERPDLETWEKAHAAMGPMGVTEATTQDLSRSMDVLEEDGSLHFWWYDAYERREKGAVYFFGKVLNKSTNRYISCSVAVRNIERSIFVLPRQHKLDDQGNPTTQEVAMTDVHEEISSVCARHNITKFLAKPVTRKYAFELPDVPRESEYLKLHYSYELPQLPEESSGTTYSRLFGVNTGPLEHLLVKRDIMGPSWLKIDQAQISNTNETWCKIEIGVNDPKLVNPLKDQDGNAPTHMPPLVVLALSLRTVMNHQKNENEIVAASGLVCNQVQIDEPTPLEAQSKSRFTIVRQLANTPYPAGFNEAAAREKKLGFPIQVERTENALLNCLIAKIHITDPDVVVGHNFAGFDLDVMLHRMKKLNTQHWHKLGRIRRKNWPKLQSGAGGTGESTYQERMIMSGRLVCDTYLASKDLIRSKSYRLTDLAQSQLKIAREDIEFDKINKYYEESQSLIHLVKHCAFDAFLSTSLMFKLQILPLTKQLTNLAGNMWSRSMTGARAERNEFLLLHEFHRHKYICPDKTFPKNNKAVVIEQGDMDQDEVNEQLQTKKSKGRRKPAYTGGLVLEPKKGFYDKYVLLLDFNSLYPSIIQEYNVCFTTVQRHNLPENADNEGEDNVPDVPDTNVAQGLLPRLLKTLVERRRQVKKLMKDPKLSNTEKMQYDIRQMALKLTANSMYGCLGFTHSRFYAKPLAMLITYKGREILQNTVDLAGNLDLNVIYGDTDSIMVYTNESEVQKVKEIGNMFKRRVNEMYNLLEIDIDGLFKHMLLLKKKKYAALLVEENPDGTLKETVETKGLDLVRRDWCDLSHDVSSRVLSFILSDKDREEVVNEIHEYLRQVGEEIRKGEVSLEKFIINKQLTKNPHEYADAKNQPHVQVALRMRAAGISVRAGDTIPYVICQVDHIPNGSKTGFAEKAFHPDDVVHGEKSLDIEWYLHQQVHPPIARLCSPIDGTDIARLAECLGLDGSKYNVGRIYDDDQDEEFTTLESQISDAERFKDAERLRIRCNLCSHEQVFEGMTRKANDNEIVSGLQCEGCHGTISEAVVRSALIRCMRSYIRKYYEGWLVCDDATCGSRTRMMSVFGRRCLREGCHGSVKREYTDKQLYTQLLYFSNMFDAERAKENALSSGSATVQINSLINLHHNTFHRLKAVADGYLDRSGYRHVDIAKLMTLANLTFPTLT